MGDTQHQSLRERRTRVLVAESERYKYQTMASFVLSTVGMAQDLKRLLELTEHYQSPPAEASIRYISECIERIYLEHFGSPMVPATNEAQDPRTGK